MGHLHGQGRGTGQIWTQKKKKPGERGFGSGQDKQKIKKSESVLTNGGASGT